MWPIAWGGNSSLPPSPSLKDGTDLSDKDLPPLSLIDAVTTHHNLSHRDGGEGGKKSGGTTSGEDVETKKVKEGEGTLGYPGVPVGVCYSRADGGGASAADGVTGSPDQSGHSSHRPRVRGLHLCLEPHCRYHRVRVSQGLNCCGEPRVNLALIPL